MAFKNAFALSALVLAAPAVAPGTEGLQLKFKMDTMSEGRVGKRSEVPTTHPCAVCEKPISNSSTCMLCSEYCYKYAWRQAVAAGDRVRAGATASAEPSASAEAGATASADDSGSKFKLFNSKVIAAQQSLENGQGFLHSTSMPEFHLTAEDFE